MKKTKFILSAYCLFTVCIVDASLKLYPRTRTDGSIPPTRSMIIALNESEKDGLGPVTYNVLVALLQKACPVLVSTSVIKHLLTLPSLTELIEKEIMERHPSGYSSETEVYVLKNFFIKKFNPEEYEIYVVNPSLLLFIPHAYTKNLGRLPQPTKVLSSTELLQGLKVDHLQKVTFDQLKKLTSQHKSGIPSKYFAKDALYGGKIPAQSSAIDSPLFITSAWYEDKQLIPQWVFYLIGHSTEQSLLDSQIAGLHVPWFRNTLAFLNSKITTKLLVYISCYSAGSYMDLIYKHPINPAIDEYRFPIVTAGVANLMTSVARATTSDASGGIIFSLRFDLFFAEATTDNPIGYEHLIPLVFTGLDYLLPAHYRQEPRPSLPFNPYNFPLIRPAGRDFFVPLVPVLHITPLMIAQRSTPLDVQQYVRTGNALTDRIYIMLDVDMVPFPLIVQRSKHAPVIASSLATTSQLVQLQTAYSLQELLKERAFVGNSERIPFFIHIFTGLDPRSKPGMTPIGNAREHYANVMIIVDEQAFVQALATNQQGDVIFIDGKTTRAATPEEKKIYSARITDITSQDPSEKIAEQLSSLLQVTIPLTNQLLVDAITNLDIQAVEKFLEDYRPIIDETVTRRIQEMEQKKLSKQHSETLAHIKESIERYKTARKVPLK